MRLAPVLLAAALGVAPSSAARGQAAAASAALASAPASGSAAVRGDNGSTAFLHSGDLVFFGTLAAGTAVLWQFDDDIQRFLMDSAHRNSTVDDVAIGLRKVNERSAFAASLLTFAIGKIAGKPRVAEVGFHAAEGVFAAAGVQTLVKNAFGRSRPFVTNHTNPSDLHPGKGFKDPWYRSMPSLHTGGMFALAVVSTAEIDRWHPGSMRYVRPVAYLVALSPGLARMYDDRHWSTDVLVGASTGYWAAKKVMRYHHPPSDPNRRRRFDRWLLGADVMPVGDGSVTVGVNIDF